MSVLLFHLKTNEFLHETSTLIYNSKAENFGANTHLNEPLVVLGASLDHARQWVREPLLEVPVRLEDVGHQEMHQRPEFHQIVLKGRALRF